MFQRHMPSQDKRLNTSFIRFIRFPKPVGTARINRINTFRVYPVSGRRFAGGA